MSCHDRADKIEGRPKRNWGEEVFTCSACIVKAQNKPKRRGRRPKSQLTAEEPSQLSSQDLPPDSEYPVSQDPGASDAMQIELTTDSSLKPLTPMLVSKDSLVELPAIVNDQVKDSGQFDIDMMSQSPNGHEPVHDPAQLLNSHATFLQATPQPQPIPNHPLHQYPISATADTNLWQLPPGNMTNGSEHV
jgi:hypothetical protein